MARRKADAGEGDHGEPKIGHNSNLNSSEKKKLEGYVREIEHVDQQARDLGSDRAQIYKRAKAEGFDNKAVRELIRLRRMQPEMRNLLLDTVDVYMSALGMLADTPLGQAAMARDGVQPQPAA